MTVGSQSPEVVEDEPDVNTIPGQLFTWHFIFHSSVNYEVIGSTFTSILFQFWSNSFWNQANLVSIIRTITTYPALISNVPVKLLVTTPTSKLVAR